MAPVALRVPLRHDGAPAHAVVVASQVSDGDFALDAAGSAERRDALAGRPVTWLRQVHGDAVVVVGAPAEHAGAAADAAVTRCSGAALAVHTADCAPIALIAANGVVGAVHAGWRGLCDGVVDRALDAMAGLGAVEVHAVLGPCIGVECYEFGAADLDRVAEELGPSVRGVTAAGTPALDLAQGVAAALQRRSVPLRRLGERCTACSVHLFSHRRRADSGRQVLLVWIEPSPEMS